MKLDHDTQAVGAARTVARSMLIALAALLGTCGSVARGAEIAAQLPTGTIGYNQYIRPILSDNCFSCHGPDKNRRKAKLRLDDRDVALAIGAIVPGKPEKSGLVERIFSVDDKEHMPPAESHKTLSPAQKELLKRWVAQGAAYELHWAYIAPRRPAMPAVKDSEWIKSPVDAPILAALESRNLLPSRPADKAQLLRRLSLDLIGIPPTPAEVRAFIADNSLDAYEKQVDRLLASPHFGERMAVPWLDEVRFADTVGFHGDQNQNVFPYRDYVIDSFNHNKPFDQFTIEQIAGDLLPNPTTEQRVATCFNRLNMMTREGGAQANEYLAKYAADRVRTVAMAWMGSTMGCCECHDHKFDPFSAKDFYSLGAFWADVKQWGIYSDYNYTPNPDLRGFTNEHPFPPEIVVDSAYLHQRIDKLNARIDDIIAAAGDELKNTARSAEVDSWRRETADFLHEHPDGYQVLAANGLGDVSSATPSNATKLAAGDGSILLTGKAGAEDRFEFTLSAGRVASIRIELLPHEHNGGKILRGTGESIAVAMSASLKPAAGKDAALSFWHADADLKDERYNNGYALIGMKDMWKTSTGHAKSPQTAVYLLDVPANVSDGDTLTIRLPKSSAGCVRFSISPIAPAKPIDATFAADLAKNLTAHAASTGPLVARTFLLSTGWNPAALAQVRQIQKNILEYRDGKSPVMVTVAVEPREMRVLARGNWQDQSGQIVTPAPPHFLPLPANPEGRRLNRLDLARWLVAPENPLTARVFVNRLWKQFFGAGIVNSVEDLGSQGEWPSHPELLDWLAVEFRESGWDVKHMVRLMVTSAAYRQDSNLRPELKDIDPGNRLLAFQNPRRLEAEFVRDNALAIAGLLDEDLGGPSVFPYQPVGYYVNIQFPDRHYLASTDDRQYRRGLYMHWQRTFLHPMLANFDAPSREDAVCTRNVSNTPQQALTLLNDPEYVEASRVLAEKVLAGSDSDDRRLDEVFERALSRLPRDRERESLRKFLQEQRVYYTAHVDDAGKLVHVGISPVKAGLDEAELASWANTCRVVLNLHETITRY